MMDYKTFEAIVRKTVADYTNRYVQRRQERTVHGCIPVSESQRGNEAVKAYHCYMRDDDDVGECIVFAEKESGAKIDEEAKE